MLLKAIGTTDEGIITVGKVYEAATILDLSTHGYGLVAVVFDDEGEWSGVDLTFFVPAIERS